MATFAAAQFAKKIICGASGRRFVTLGGVMDTSDLLLEGVELMFIGMTTVFVFLVMLVFVISMMSRILNRYFPEPIAAPKVAPKPAAVAAGSVDPELVSAIGAAIKQHRARRG